MLTYQSESFHKSYVGWLKYTYPQPWTRACGVPTNLHDIGWSMLSWYILVPVDIEIISLVSQISPIRDLLSDFAGHREMPITHLITQSTDPACNSNSRSRMPWEPHGISDATICSAFSPLMSQHQSRDPTARKLHASRN